MRALALAALALTAGAAAPHNVNVSRLPGPQTEPAIVIDPNNAHVLLAGSNSITEGTMRIYTSNDGGAVWETSTTHAAPPRLLDSCASDPSVAIDRRGRQYYSYGLAAPCGVDRPQRVFVLTRAGDDALWSKPILVAALGRARLDDKPAIAVDNSPVSGFPGRLYAVWTRVQRNASLSVMLSRSDDGAETWTRPVKVNRTGRDLSYASVAVARNGTVYVAWNDVGEFSLQIARSTDGGARFDRQVRVAGFASIWIPHCGSGIVIPALPRTCVQANPIVSVDASGGRYSGRVYVSYARTEFRGYQAAHVAVFTPALERLYRDPETREGRPVALAPRGRRSEQFWPQSAVDQATGAVWVCYYDTLGDPERRRAHYTCTASRNGGRTWLKPVRVAAAASDATQPGAAGGYGYYQGLAAGHGVAYPVWTDTRDLASAGEEIYTARLTLADFR
jgi:hypothetical protein